MGHVPIFPELPELSPRHISPKLPEYWMYCIADHLTLPQCYLPRTKITEVADCLCAPIIVWFVWIFVEFQPVVRRLWVWGDIYRSRITVVFILWIYGAKLHESNVWKINGAAASRDVRKVESFVHVVIIHLFNHGIVYCSILADIFVAPYQEHWIFGQFEARTTQQ